MASINSKQPKSVYRERQQARRRRIIKRQLRKAGVAIPESSLYDIAELRKLRINA